MANDALQTEVADHQRTQEALRRAEERFQSMFEHATVGIFQTTPDGRYLAISVSDLDSNAWLLENF